MIEKPFSNGFMANSNAFRRGRELILSERAELLWSLWTSCSCVCMCRASTRCLAPHPGDTGEHRHVCRQSTIQAQDTGAMFWAG